MTASRKIKPDQAGALRTPLAGVDAPSDGRRDLSGADHHQVVVDGVRVRPKEAMNQEKRALDLLPKIETSEIDDAGALILKRASGTAISARRR